MSRHVTRMGLADAEHYTAAEREAIVAGYPAHERKARVEGLPAMGSGAVFPVDLEAITVPATAIPPHWPQIGGLDFGYDHPTAAVTLAYDPDTDVLYVTREFAVRQAEALPVLVAAAVRPWGEWLPWAWPHDGLAHDKGSGAQIAQLFRDQGLQLLEHHATHPPAGDQLEGQGGYGVEAGLFEMLDRMQTGRWKVFATCTGWLGEAQTYHRKNGQVVKRVDDRLSDSRYAMMMRRFAATRPRSGGPRLRNLRGVV